MTHVVPTGELRVALQEAGDGPPVVLVHGGLGGRRLWEPVVSRLAVDFRCIAYDLRGHGETLGGEDVPAFTPELLARDLVALLDALELDRAHVVGSSVGGFVAQELAIGHPDRLDRLVLADTWMSTAIPPSLAKAAPWIELALGTVGTGPLAGLSGLGMSEEAAALLREATTATSRSAAVRVWRGLLAHDTRSRLERVSAPTLVVCGAQDLVLSQSRRMAALIPDAQLSIIPGAGHNSHLAATEAFAALVSDFLLNRS